jgi:hypothetical protein
MNVRIHALLPLVGLLASCTGEYSTSDRGTPLAGPESPGVVEGLRLDVVPTDIPVSLEADATVLPQSVRIDSQLRVGEESFDLGVVDLLDPVIVAGSVVGQQSTPQRPVADLPGEEEPAPVSGEVRLLHPTALQSYRLVLEADGGFGGPVVPDDYTLVVVPDDPSFPLHFQPLTLTDDTFDLDLDIGAGAAVYGFVQVDGVPLQDARVELERDGVVSARATTNSNGFYEVRADPGTYTVRSLGRANNVDPVLTLSSLELTADGARHDIDYPAVEQVLVEGRLEQVGGGDLDRTVTVRFTSTSLDGLETLAATYTTEVPTKGSFLVRMPPGIYDLEVLPPAVEAGVDYTPARLDELVVDGALNLGTLPIDELRAVDGTVSDPQQQLVPGVAVACREDAYGRRSWSTVTDDDGRFALDLPRVPVTCTLAPPVDRRDVALTRRSFDPADNASPSLELARGQTVGGRVQRDGEGEAFVVVELRGPDDLLLGSALTDDEGAYEMQVDLAAVADPTTGDTSLATP